MTRKDYQLIIELMLDVVRPRCKDPDDYKVAVRIVALRLEYENKNFDNAKFMQACGL